MTWTENQLREWRMANNRDAYPQDVSYREGFGGLIGEITDRWCKECEQNIQLPHRVGCRVGIAEEVRTKYAEAPPSSPPNQEDS